MALGRGTQPLPNCGLTGTEPWKWVPGLLFPPLLRSLPCDFNWPDSAGSRKSVEPKMTQSLYIGLLRCTAEQKKMVNL